MSRPAVVLLAIAVALACTTEARLADGSLPNYNSSSYLTGDQLATHLEAFTQRCPNISRLVTVGHSAQGVPLLALEISDRPGRAENPKPNVKLVGGIHGDEPVGRSVSLALAAWICANQQDPQATRIVRGVHLWILPDMNPDGFAARTRGNSARVDLNRDFPDRFEGFADAPGRQPETEAIMAWTRSMHFVSSLAFHGGALVASYPWDGNADETDPSPALAPDDATFRHLATTYARAHPGMVGAAENPEFPSGITNGAAWYTVHGGMQDWNYVVGKCMELTIEMGEDKRPPESELAQAFEDHRLPILDFITASALGGLRGRVVTRRAGRAVALGGADVSVDAIDWTVQSGEAFGDFYRPLAPGRYSITVRKAGYTPARATVTVPPSGAGLARTFVLSPTTAAAKG